MDIKQKIKNYFENLPPKKLKLKKEIKVISISRLGQGANNLNYLVNSDQGKFIFRLNAKLKEPCKSRKEYGSLKIVEKTKIAPKVYLIDDSRKEFDSDFIVLGYLDGKLCKNVRPYFDEKMIREVAKLLAKIHKVKLTLKIKKELSCRFLDYESHIKEIQDEIDYFKKNINNKDFFYMLENSIENLKQRTKNKKMKNGQVLSQGDFHEGNIIVDKGKYFLIDFERLEITNKSSALAQIFVNFKKSCFSKQQQEIFLDEYQKQIKSDRGVSEEIEIFIPLMSMILFLWSIEFIIKIKNEEMHKNFVENSNYEKNIKNAITRFKQALKFGAIDKKYKDFDLYKLLKNYLHA